MPRIAIILIFSFGFGLGFLSGRAVYLDATPDPDLAGPDEEESPSHRNEEAIRRRRAPGDRGPARRPGPTRTAPQEGAPVEDAARGAPAAASATAMPEADPEARLTITGLLFDASGRLLPQTSLRGVLVAPRGEVGAFCRTDAAGRFHWHHQGAIPPGVTRFEIWPQALPSGRLEVWTPPASIARTPVSSPVPRGTLDVGSLRLEAAARVVAGRVSDASGRPLAGAEVEIVVAPPGRPAGRLPGDGMHVGGFFDLARQGLVLDATRHDLETDAEGRFELRGSLEVGEIKLRARAAGRVPSELVVTRAGDVAVEFRLVPGTEQTIRLRRRDGREVGSVRHELLPDARPDWRPWPATRREAADLELHYSDLPRGPARLRVREDTGRVLHDAVIEIDGRDLEVWID